MLFEDLFVTVYCKDEYHVNFDNKQFSDDNYKLYYKGYLVHQVDGPAIEWDDGKKRWYKEGSLHREDGPTVELIQLNGYKKWYLNNIEYTEKEFNKVMSFKNKEKILDII